MSGAPHIAHDEHHRALVTRFSKELTPTRPLWPVSARLGLWAAVEVGILAWVMTHTRNQFAAKLTHPLYIVEIVLFATAAIILAALALKSAIPGRRLPARAATMAIAFILTGTIAVTIAHPIDTTVPLHYFVRAGVRCADKTIILSALPWLVLWWLVKRGASMSAWLSWLLVGAGALLFSFAAMRIACPSDEPLHLLIWHLLPALAVIGLSAIAGSIWLRFRPRSRYAAAE
jgi:hypothetical protein